MFSKNGRSFGVVPPDAAPDRRGIAIVAIAKNEERYIADWAVHHLACEASHIYLYDNGSTDGTLDQLGRIRTDRVTVIPWKNRFYDAELKRPLHTQVLAYAHAVANFGGTCRWMTFIDIDEMLIPKTGTTLMEALAHLEAFSYISLPWHMFGRCGHKAPPEGPVACNYLARARDPMHRELCNFKYIVDPTQVDVLRVHRCRTRNGGTLTVNDRGTMAPNEARQTGEFYSSDYIQLNHYYCKSDVDMEERFSRGWVSFRETAGFRKKYKARIKLIEGDSVEDLSARRLYEDPQFRRRRQALIKAESVVAELSEQRVEPA